MIFEIGNYYISLSFYQAFAEFAQKRHKDGLRAALE